MITESKNVITFTSLNKIQGQNMIRLGFEISGKKINDATLRDLTGNLPGKFGESKLFFSTLKDEVTYCSFNGNFSEKFQITCNLSGNKKVFDVVFDFTGNHRKVNIQSGEVEIQYPHG